MFLDQSSNQLIRTHYLGRDGFVWWLGVVVLPTTGKWSGQDIINGKKPPEYYNRVKVRIFGYHTKEGGQLPDADLPWAHVLVPPGVANGVLSQGDSHEYQGGETVFGFFLDGDDGQQPVIIGSLYKGSNISDLITSAQVASKNSSEFLPVSPGELGAHQISIPPANGGQNVATGVGNPADVGVSTSVSKSGIENISRITDKNVDQAAGSFAKRSDIKSNPPNPCKSDKISKITDKLEDFLARLEGYQAYANLYVGGIANKLGNIESEIRETGMEIASLFTDMVKLGMKWLFDEYSKKMDNLIADLFPKPKQNAAGQVIRTYMSTIYCLFKKFIKKIFTYVVNQLKSLVGQVLGTATCLVENFVGQMLNSMFNSLADAVGPTLQQLSNFLGGALGNANDILAKAMNVVGFIKNLFNCEPRNCTPPQSYTTRYGPSQKEIDNFNKILKQAGVGGLKNLKSDLYQDLGLEDVDLSFGSCTPDVLRCGPPSIAILGGGGNGASATAIVNNLGQVIGANILNGGGGYFEPPYVSFIDSCNNGQNARGRAIINGGQVTSIVIDEPGSGYLNTQTVQTYGSEPAPAPSDGSTDANANSYVTQFNGVNVDNIGVGYGEDTSIVVIPGDNDIGLVTLPEFQITYGPNGSILNIDVVAPGSGFTELPELLLVSLTGAGAKVKPTFDFIEVNKEDAGALGVGRVIQVVDCVQR